MFNQISSFHSLSNQNVHQWLNGVHFHNETQLVSTGRLHVNILVINILAVWQNLQQMCVLPPALLWVFIPVTAIIFLIVMGAIYLASSIFCFDIILILYFVIMHLYAPYILL